MVCVSSTVPPSTLQLLGRITTRNHPDLNVRDTGHILLFVGLPCTGSLSTSTHTHTHTPYGISSQIFTTVQYFSSCFLRTVRASKALKTKILHKEQTSHTLKKNLFTKSTMLFQMRRKCEKIMLMRRS